MVTQGGPPVRSAPDAASLAGVSYRQLDYWTRKCWILPADVDRVSPGRVVRRYGTAQILQCALLAHIGRSGVDLTPYGPQVGHVGTLGTDQLVVVDQDGRLEVVAAGRLRRRVGEPGRYVVFDPAPVLRRIARHSATGAHGQRTA